MVVCVCKDTLNYAVYFCYISSSPCPFIANGTESVIDGGFLAQLSICHEEGG